MSPAREPADAPRRGALAAVVLAGGASSRWGVDKAFLDCAGQPLLRRQIALARAAGAQTVWISGRAGVDYTGFSCPVVLDTVPGAGPLAGLAAALRVASPEHAWLLALAVDLPAMTADYLRLLAAEAAATGLGVLPKRGEYFEPLAAVYSVAPALAAAEAQLAAGRFALQVLAAELVARAVAFTRPIAPEERALFANWNDAAGPRVAEAD